MRTLIHTITQWATNDNERRVEAALAHINANALTNNFWHGRTA